MATDMKALAKTIVDEWEKDGPAHMGDQVLLYASEPATYFTWAAERHGVDVFGDSARKQSVNGNVRAEAKKRGLSWADMKKAVAKRAWEILKSRGFAELYATDEDRV